METVSTESVQVEIPGVLPPLAKVSTAQIRLGFIERGIASVSETMRFKLQSRESIFDEDKFLEKLQGEFLGALAELKDQ